jgi:hypothetical protein
VPANDGCEPISLGRDARKIVRELFEIELFLISKLEDGTICMRIAQKRV